MPTPNDYWFLFLGMFARFIEFDTIKGPSNALVYVTIITEAYYISIIRHLVVEYYSYFNNSSVCIWLGEGATHIS